MIKNFIMTYIIKPKSEREEIPQDVFNAICGTLIIPLFAIGYIIVGNAYDAYATYETESRQDLCRIRGAIINEDLTYTYLCASEKIGKKTYMLIHEDESKRIKRNGYHGRPVIVYKDGRVK